MMRTRGTALARFAAAPAALVTVLATAGCSSDSSDSGPAVSVQQVRAHEESLAEGAPCPFKFDEVKALRASGVTGRVGPGTPPAVGDAGPARPATPAQPSSSSAPARPAIPGTPEVWLITCSYRANATDVSVAVLASPAAESAVSMLAPLIVKGGEISTAQLEAFLPGAMTAEPGAVSLTPGPGAAAVVRVPVKGEGGVALLVTTETGSDHSPDPALSGEALRKVAAAFAEGVRF
ncbi:hypothetical protein [Yinghuangia seranimata]|uniref:hypothetical protein n=1 Tax=Yinghuangia seranimata TaxID=408067 RepID=UPI00248BB3C6|nr:hypothetical protein [Yinghuangia seranimata]MDI2129925.1 hypothetical protein [Yinghuangia seranimata]